MTTELEEVESVLEQLVEEGRVVRVVNDEGEIVYRLVEPKTEQVEP